MPDTISDQRTTGSTTTQRPRERLAERLSKAGVDPQRCCPIKDGTKVSYDHNAREVPSKRSGNYTIHGGDKLVVLDIDVPRDDLPEWVKALPETFVVETVHGGLHLYFAVPEDARVSNTKGYWGSVRYDGFYVVGPGSSVDHDEYCDDGKEGCPGTGVGEYSIKHDRRIATLTGDDLDRLAEACEGEESTEGSDTSTASVESSKISNNVEWTSLDEDTRRLIERAKDFDKWGDEFTDLKEGRYAEAGFGDDRSRAEYRLLEMLGWLFDDEEELIRQVMTAICRLNPQTNAGTRKWLVRDGSYREQTLRAACQHESTYEPHSTYPLDRRPEVSYVTSSKVFEAVFDLGLASSSEIAEHDTVDRSQRQVRRALKEYQEEGLIQSARDGRRVLYYFRKEFIPSERRKRYGL